MASSSPTKTEKPTLASKLKRVIALPYIVGTIWCFLLPAASILTGDFTKPRGWYVDENSLETSNLRVEHKYKAINWKKYGQPSDTQVSLCDVLAEDTPDRNNIECHRHQSSAEGSPDFDLVKFIPTTNTLDPSNEAITLVAPYPSLGNWRTSQLHVSLLELLRRLASADSTPWLAKTIYFIAPTSKESSLSEVVDAFLESYAGSYHGSLEFRMKHLPASMSDAMIRNLLVLDTRPSQDIDLSKDEVRILPTGKLGVLPNMDLVFVTMAVYSRSPSTGNARRSGNNDSPTILMHPYGQKARQWESFVKEKLEAFSVDPKVEKWAINLGNLALFCQSLYQGPYAPHAFALDRGIDAITIQGRYSTSNGTKPSTFVQDYVQKLEITLRGLSNLHERLHHSTTLYLLPSPLTFVKHEEYLVPNLLLLIPIVLRAALLALSDIRRFDLLLMGWIVLLTVAATLWLDVSMAGKDLAQRNAYVSLVYVTCFGVFYEKVLKELRDRDNALQCAQLVICLMTIYLHVPICFGNVAVSFPSAFLWAPFVAFPSFAPLYRSRVGTAVMLAFLVLTCPPIGPINALFSNTYAPYVRFLYFPLHLALSLSCVLAMLQT